MTIYTIAMLVVYAAPLRRLRHFGEMWFIRLKCGSGFWQCRTCIGFWVGIPVTLIVGGGVLDYIVMYGTAVFLATQERKS